MAADAIPRLSRRPPAALAPSLSGGNAGECVITGRRQIPKHPEMDLPSQAVTQTARVEFQPPEQTGAGLAKENLDNADVTGPM